MSKMVNNIIECNQNYRQINNNQQHAAMDIVYPRSSSSFDNHRQQTIDDNNEQRTRRLLFNKTLIHRSVSAENESSRLAPSSIVNGAHRSRRTDSRYKTMPIKFEGIREDDESSTTNDDSSSTSTSSSTLSNHRSPHVVSDDWFLQQRSIGSGRLSMVTHRLHNSLSMPPFGRLRSNNHQTRLLHGISEPSMLSVQQHMPRRKKSAGGSLEHLAVDFLNLPPIPEAATTPCEGNCLSQIMMREDSEEEDYDDEFKPGSSGSASSKMTSIDSDDDDDEPQIVIDDGPFDDIII